MRGEVIGSGCAFGPDVFGRVSKRRLRGLMLRKIVNILMGSADGRTMERTLFEGLLERLLPLVEGRFTPDLTDPLELVAQTLMQEVAEGEAVDPQAARAFFSVLVENDRLPLGQQLDLQELELLKALLMDYFAGRDSVRQRANEVLSLIERKFSQGAFTQAKILLQIFETDGETRLNNERNLFYEDMIMRLGLRRRHEIPKAEREAIRQVFAGLDGEQDSNVKDALAWMGSEYYAHMCFAIKSPDDYQQWAKVTASLAPEARDRLLGYVPPVRWRTPASVTGLSLIEMSAHHLCETAIRLHVQRLFRMCYFLLLASGDTGFEAYIFNFMRWSKDFLGVDTKRVLPVIHRRSVVDEVSLQESLDEAYQHFFSERVSEKIVVRPEKIKRAWSDLCRRFAALDITQVPAGHYDLGGFLLDHLLGFEHIDPAFAFRLYRLS